MKKTLLLSALVSLSFAAAQKTVTLPWSGAITGPTSDAGASYGGGRRGLLQIRQRAEDAPGHYPQLRHAR